MSSGSSSNDQRAVTLGLVASHLFCMNIKFFHSLNMFKRLAGIKRGYFFFLIALLILVILVEVFILTGTHTLPLSERKLSFSDYADRVIATCASSDYHPGCYDKEIPKLMDIISMEDAFKVTAIIQQKDSQYWYCHVLGHNLASRETAKNSEKWKEIIPRCPAGMCSNGCIHGALQERFRKEKFSESEMERVLPDLTDVCDERPQWHPTGMERATCYHALGHLLMYLTDADTKKSVESCDKIAKKPDGSNFLTVCHDGVFMQLFQPLEPEDFALVEGKTPSKEALKSFCSIYPAKIQASCWSEGWPLYWDQVKIPDGLMKFCFVLEKGVAQDRCFNGMFFVMASEFRLDMKKIIAFCDVIPLPERGRCFANGAGRMIETDAKLVPSSLAICAQAAMVGAGDACYNELVTYAQFNFHSGADAQKELCDGLPLKWRTSCGSIPRR